MCLVDVCSGGGVAGCDGQKEVALERANSETDVGPSPASKNHP